MLLVCLYYCSIDGALLKFAKHLRYQFVLFISMCFVQYYHPDIIQSKLIMINQNHC